MKPADACRWDLVSLGEVMLRLDPGEGRIAAARTFRAWEGGGEYNVARALARCFGLRTTIVTALADNPVGRLIEGLMREGGVDVSHVSWVDYDGIGRSARNGLNFTERGFGVRGALGCSDRGHTAVSQLEPGDVDWDRLFGGEGARWFHTGGIFCALSPLTPRVAAEAMQAARRHGTVVSYDLNYRESLWQAQGGRARADEVARELAPYIDVMLGRAEVEKVAAQFPQLKAVAAGLREVKSASRCDWGATCWHEGRRFDAPARKDLEVLDRVGSGDAFAAGLIFGLLEGRDGQYAVDCGAACGAHAMTTPGDSLMATRVEIERLMKGAGGGASR